MKRHFWKSSLSDKSCPAWNCIACAPGILRLQSDLFKYEETRESKQSRGDEAFDASWIEYSFTAWAKCDNEKCGQQYAISGSGGVEPRYTAEDDWDYFDCFEPTSIHPTLPIINVPKKSPTDVKDALSEAFKLYWASTEACAGRIRVAVEHLLTHVGVPREKTDESGKQIKYNLHTRIESYAKTEPKLGAQLMAIKWIGNTASHRGGISKTDLLDTFEVLEYVLSEIIMGNSKRIEELARKLAEKHSQQGS
ncbi:DUF4145 domain-containing protein [Thiomonas sp. X19]|uniref:DUF4145 domain-containing protein n=1 Tax=Thiomonas sp. X19 TaxID=1050370 RepID=UPI001314B331|nr:DUF4145 domain-containing protein [Thiomonas sp. X19]